MKRMMLVVIAGVAVAGCSRPYLEEPPWPAATPVAAAPARVNPPRQSTSLWADGSSLTGGYDDRRARHVGDLVTVVVVESSEASREASTDLKRDSSVDANISAMLGAPTSFGLNSLYGSSGFKPEIGATTNNSFKGQGTTTRKDLLRTRVAARVVNVLEDGNMVVEGRRQVQVNEENQYLFVRGIARPTDISPDNSIASAALADAQIVYGGKGDLSDHQRRGWLTRVIDVVWPF